MSRGGVEVIEDGVMSIVDLAYQLAQAKAQIHILIPVAKLGIEAISPLEIHAADQETGARYDLDPSRPVHCRVVGRKARIQVAWGPILANRYAGVLDRVVWEQQFATGNRGFRMHVRISHQGFQPFRLRYRIVIQEDQVLAMRDGRGVVARNCKALIDVVRDNTDAVAVALQEVGCKVSRGVIYDYDLEINIGG